MSDTRQLGDIRKVQAALGDSCRSLIEKLLRNDPDFPQPINIGGKREWFLDEIEDYKATRPRRQYADTAI